MSAIIDLRAFLDRSSVPMLVLVDLHKDYVDASRIATHAEVREAVANCRIALAHARSRGFPVAFARRRNSPAPSVTSQIPCSRWLDGFEPTGVDMIFDRDGPSCYANPRFSEVIGQAGGSFVLAGLAGEAACLATAIDAFHRGHKVMFLADASASHALDEIGPRDVHRVVEKIIDLYGDAIGTATWIAATSRKRDVSGRSRWTMA